MNKERAAAYLAQGILPSTVASIVGCTPAYITQLLKDEDFKLLVQQKTSELATEATEETLLDTKYVALEHKILGQIETNLPNAELGDLTRALDVIARRQAQIAKARIPAAASSGTVNGNVYITQLSLPAHILPPQQQAPALQLDSNSQVIAINDRPLAPMNSDTVRTMFDRIAAKRKAISNQPTERETIEREF